MKFKITYRDPDTEEEKVVIETFESTTCIVMDSTVTISDRESAEDYAYSLADKGWYHIEELKDI